MELVRTCTRCSFDVSLDVRPISESNFDPRIMFVADTPGARSSGPSNGSRLDHPLIVEARKRAGLENAYGTYLVKCRYPEQMSTALSFAKCIDFLRQEIYILQPQVIVTIGQTVQFDDSGKIHVLGFPDLIREFVDPHIAVRSTIDPEEIRVGKEDGKDTLQKFFDQYAAIAPLIH